ncbi:CRISPR-associated helicase/endonuclease Cas3 [Rhodopirellula sp. MGV]|uniref:CRISPR-associated helicase/endonuclease Cas3 n=1 Tax=Rhodopirellula sp. MGV TaxID=2023130 RepID=UPI000B96BAD5|nr:CRISPR-associated helicase/endonuclease Cas3 [Rhodopirellula sp. MGV]OYP35551.1 hypothetical protein CGZ80_11180 [Rhodopirellula sp. MGV]PNY34588.1 CRISPR-associated helicase Cas3' [Rhodopirellula baltica]
MQYFAHSLPDRPQSDWEPLIDHLRNVAIGDERTNGAGDNAEFFNARELAQTLGWLHDVGKASVPFQHRINNRQADPSDERDAFSSESQAAIASRPVDHSTAGARLVESQGGVGRLLAYAIAGHHAGMPDWTTLGRSGLMHRLNKAKCKIPLVDENFVAAIADNICLKAPKIDPNPAHEDISFSVAMLGRMLFSCLVDADRLWTERFCSQIDAARPRQPIQIDQLASQLDRHLNGLNSSGTVNAIRQQVLRDCRNAASQRTGMFSLHVPTGGGKTLASMAFAIDHAKRHGLRRIIYAIPLTTIIEQTANVFRDVFGDEAVLEHHSAVDPDDLIKCSPVHRLAAENFAAPLIVTTNVQLLESLFSNRPSTCRKLHHLAGSVIVLDEVQTLPVNLLKPTLAVLTELVANYGCSIVLCSATQPAILKRDEFPIGLSDVYSIIKSPSQLHQRLKRTEVRLLGELSNADLVSRLESHHQALCIVNTRRHAADLAAMIPGAIHLSANLCGAHRQSVVATIRKHLAAGDVCRVVSTTVMEAGVDVDFPVGYRAEAGLDSIAQAAGRVNRNGRLPTADVFVFQYDRKAYRSTEMVRDGIAALRQVVELYADDLLSPNAVEHYFRLLFWDKGGDQGQGWDRGVGGEPVLACFEGDQRRRELAFQYATAAKRYRLIQTAQTPVVVPHGEGANLIDELLSEPLESLTSPWLRAWDRKASRYSVNVFEFDQRKLLENTAVIEQHGRLLLCNPNAYDETLGLRTDVLGMGASMLVC